MLIRFLVENFLSFNEETEFNMLAGNLKTHKNHVHKQNGLELLSTTVIYGSNGAGKSNLIKAIDFFLDIIKTGNLNRSINSKKFKLNNDNKDKNVAFEIEFSTNNKIYSYGIKIDGSNIIEEWLYETGLKKEKLIFERQFKNSKQSIKIAGKYSRTKRAKVLIDLMEENLLSHNDILLGKSELLKIEELDIIRAYLSTAIVIIYPNSKFGGLLTSIIESKSFHNFSNNLLKTFDTGLESLETEIIDIDKFFGEDDTLIKDKIIEEFSDENVKSLTFHFKYPILITRHNGQLVVNKILAQHSDNNGKKILFDIDDESDGTKRLIDFIPLFHGVFNRDVTFIVDEIDQSLHPSLLLTLVNKVINDTAIKGQFIFTTHESNLLNLDIFRQDEIWFAEKDKKNGDTKLYSLEEFKPRTDLDIRKGYLKGRFGAIPFLANLQELKWN